MRKKVLKQFLPILLLLTSCSASKEEGGITSGGACIGRNATHVGLFIQSYWDNDDLAYLIFNNNTEEKLVRLVELDGERCPDYGQVHPPTISSLNKEWTVPAKGFREARGLPNHFLRSSNRFPGMWVWSYFAMGELNELASLIQALEHDPEKPANPGGIVPILLPYEELGRGIPNYGFRFEPKLDSIQIQSTARFTLKLKFSPSSSFSAQSLVFDQTSSKSKITRPKYLHNLAPFLEGPFEAKVLSVKMGGQNITQSGTRFVVPLNSEVKDLEIEYSLSPLSAGVMAFVFFELNYVEESSHVEPQFWNENQIFYFGFEVEK